MAKYEVLIIYMVKERHLRLLYQLAADIIITIIMSQTEDCKE
jgi:hypothetical protein